MKLAAEVAVPPGVVTEILTVPAACALVLADDLGGACDREGCGRCCAELDRCGPGEVGPGDGHCGPAEVEPLVGVKLVIVGAWATKVKFAAEVAVPPAVVTEILTVPAACALVMALILVALVTV